MDYSLTTQVIVTTVVIHVTTLISTFFGINNIGVLNLTRLVGRGRSRRSRRTLGPATSFAPPQWIGKLISL